MKPLNKFRYQKIEDKIFSQNGEKFLSGKLKILLNYRRKKYNLLDLVESLIAENTELKKTQCIPQAKCIFDVREKLGERAVEKYYEYDE